MIKVKAFKWLPLLTLSGAALAETGAPVVEANMMPSQPVQAAPVLASAEPAAQAANNGTIVDNVLPLLSLEAQRARDAAAERARLLEEERSQKLAQAESQVRQEVGESSLLLARDVAKLYLDNDFGLMWQDQKAQRTFIREYAVFAASGVSKSADKALQNILSKPQGELARDILLTDALLDFLYYQGNVAKQANNWLYQLGSYRTRSPNEAQQQRWLSAVKNGSTAQFISNLVPRNHIYQETVQRLMSMSPNGTASNQNTAETGKKGTKGKKSNKASGTNSATFAKLALNAQRLRIIPSFDNGIFVNIPSYQLYYFRDGKLALQSKVIVGKDERRTPVMYSKLSNVVVNPPWTIPPTILSKDFIPRMAKDPGYAERRGFEIFDSKGNKVNPRSVNWASYVNSKSFPYRIRQKAGDDSALGRYKFNMPSSDAIFLHDTPNRGLFSKTDRALSSGCVRVAKADELATILLKEAGWSEGRKRNVLDSKKTTSAQIRSDNPVYLYYVTAWVENGKVHTLPDIYKFDSQIKRTNINWAAVKNNI
ncbi:L,D-transpeptidase [Pasteurellaceae bacterium RH1A]|nr:L,D-transpeptidase [Pasteurellaceae bacterium RH1A]